MDKICGILQFSIDRFLPKKFEHVFYCNLRAVKLLVALAGGIRPKIVLSILFCQIVIFLHYRFPFLIRRPNKNAVTRAIRRADIDCRAVTATTV